MAAAIITTPIRWCAVATASFRSTSMSPAAPQPPKHCYTAFYCCRKKSNASIILRAEPMDERLQQLAEHLAAAFPAAVTGSEIRQRELALRVERQALGEVLRFLRDDAKCRFTVLCDICGVDYPDRPLRFEVVYNLLSMSLNQRIRLKVET